jgi:hypothetical protein
MDIPTERPANADETLLASEIAVNTTASIVVLAAILLRLFGRWILMQRVAAGKGGKNTAFGLDDGKLTLSFLVAMMLMQILVLSIVSVICFFSFVTAVSIAIKRGMGTHVQLILYEHGVKGLIEYNQVSR